MAGDQRILEGNSLGEEGDVVEMAEENILVGVFEFAALMPAAVLANDEVVSGEGECALINHKTRFPKFGLIHPKYPLIPFFHIFQHSPKMLLDKNHSKNGPIIVLAVFCSAFIFSSILISANLFLEMLEMEADLKEGMAQFKILSDQSWEMLFHWREDDRPKRQSSYFTSWKGKGANGGAGNCQCAPSAQNCPKGVAGPTGPKGEPGTPGQNGPSGKPGASGGIFIFERVKPPCIRCPEGVQGQKGRPGMPGQPGPEGTPGQPGKQGMDGKPGEGGQGGEFGGSGPAGNTGEPGPRGEPITTWAKKGTPGAKGSPGPAGPSGESGPPGKDGQPGTDGLVGPNGQPGAPGEAGTQGIPGNQGTGGKEAPEKNYCPCPPRSEPISGGPNYSGARRGVRNGEVKLQRADPVTGRLANSGIA